MLHSFMCKMCIYDEYMYINYILSEHINKCKENYTNFVSVYRGNGNVSTLPSL